MSNLYLTLFCFIKYTLFVWNPTITVLLTLAETFEMMSIFVIFKIQNKDYKI